MRAIARRLALPPSVRCGLFLFDRRRLIFCLFFHSLATSACMHAYMHAAHGHAGWSVSIVQFPASRGTSHPSWDENVRFIFPIIVRHYERSFSIGRARACICRSVSERTSPFFIRFCRYHAASFPTIMVVALSSHLCFSLSLLACWNTHRNGE